MKHPSLCRYLIIFFLIFVLAASASAEKEQSSQKFLGERSRGLMVGVLQWQDESLSPFSNKLRKDKELHEILLSRGAKEENLKLLLDKEATLENIRQSLKELVAASSADETFVFYYAGHGLKGEGGKFYFANYDIQSDKPKETGFCLDELVTALGDTFKGERVVLLADCCYSGGLTEVAQKLAKKGKQVLALTSAAASNASTGNWTYSQTIIDGLRGALFADVDGDGQITVYDLKDEVSRAMRYGERQRFGYAIFGLDEKLFINEAKDHGPKELIATWAKDRKYRPGDYLRVQEKADGRFVVARLMPGGTKEKVAVRVYEYNKNRHILIGKEQVEAITAKSYPKGSLIRVIWGSKEWDAKVLAVQDGFHWITYPGWEAYWNEWVMDDRIVGLKSEMAKIKRCEVKWKDQWYKARVLRKEKGRYYIHYEDFDNSWDEWVGNDRIRFPEGGTK